MPKNLIRKNQLHPDIVDLVGQYGSGFFTTSGDFKRFTGQNTLSSNRYVYQTGNQTISGNKDFTNLTISGVPVLLQGSQLVNVVRTTGNQGITGLKNFLVRPMVNGTGVLLSGEATAGSINSVYTTGDQTIGGVKTFSNGININGYDLVTPQFKSLIGYITGYTDQNLDFQNLIIGMNNPGYGTISLKLNPNVYFNIGEGGFDANYGNVARVNAVYSDNTQNYDLNLTANGDINLTTNSNTNFNKRPLVNGTGVLLSGDKSIVYTTGNQTISGLKTFVTRPTVNGTGILLSGDVSILPNTIVYTTGNQNISGAKTFVTRPTINGTGVLLSGDKSIVYTTGNQTISGIKTFSNNININGYDIDNPGAEYLMGHISSYSQNNGDLKVLELTMDTITNSLMKFQVDAGIYLQLYNGGNGFKLTDGNITVESIFSEDDGCQNLQMTSNGGIVFNSPVRPVINGTGILLSGDKSIVYTTGNQTISGTKTFVSNTVLYSGVNVNFNTDTNVKFSGNVTFRNDRVWETGLVLGTNKYTIPYSGGSFSKVPKIFTNLDVTGSTVFNYNITGRTVNSFGLLFSTTLTENATLMIRATV